jgi:hypothetical protein
LVAETGQQFKIAEQRLRIQAVQIPQAREERERRLLVQVPAIQVAQGFIRYQQFELRFVEPDGHKFVVADQGLSRFQRPEQIIRLLIRQNTSVDHQIVAADVNRIAIVQVILGDIRHRRPEQALPLFADGQDTEAELANGTGCRKRE